MAVGDNAQVLNMIASSSTLIREAVAAALPVAPTQLLTIQIPGTIINVEHINKGGDYVWDAEGSVNTPHRVRVNEARLVDGMIPLSKIMMGPTGRSVARSYAAALDTLIPVEAPVDEGKQSDRKTPKSAAREAAAARYHTAMNFLNSTGEGGKKVIDLYVEKQEIWSKAMSEWEKAKADALAAAERKGKDRQEQQKIFDEWNQTYYRNYKNNVQAKYMDWVVNGNKYKVDYHFGVVDISSAMKRVEASKEAARNLVVIDPDGTTEWQAVQLEPTNWAKHCYDRVQNWRARNKAPSQKEYQFEMKRLKRLLLSYTGLKDSLAPEPGPNEVDAGTEQSDEPTKSENLLKEAYTKLYKLNNPTPEDLLDPVGYASKLKAAQTEVQTMVQEVSKENVTQNRARVQKSSVASLRLKHTWLKDMILDTKGQIEQLQDKMSAGTSSNPGLSAIEDVVSAGKDGLSTKFADENDKWADPRFKVKRDNVAPPEVSTKADPWTKISVTVDQKQRQSSSMSASSSTAASASASGWFWSASASTAYSSAMKKAAESAASCSVNISFSAMLVSINRPWLHGELFHDNELNVGQGVKLSPGPEDLKAIIDGGADRRKELTDYSSFASYPTAFIVASDIELEFQGDTTSLEDAMESSTFEANAKVDYGPFSMGASHKQEKTQSSTRMESTATGLRISLEAPSIIGWVSSLLPKLPREEGDDNALLGFSFT